MGGLFFAFLFFSFDGFLCVFVWFLLLVVDLLGLVAVGWNRWRVGKRRWGEVNVFYRRVSWGVV